MDKQIALIKGQLQELNLKHLAARLDNFMAESCCLEKPHTTFLQEAL